MTPDVMLDRLHAANPVPQPDRLDIQDDALLLMIQERSVAMSTNTERQATNGIPKLTDPLPPKRGRNGLIVAAAAFAAVVIIGAALVILTTGDEPVAPATTVPEPTVQTTATTQAPTTSSAAPTTTVAVAGFEQAESFFAAMNAGDVGAVEATFAPDAEVGNGGIPGEDQVDVIQAGEREAFFSWLIASLPTVYEIDTCEPTATRLTCRVRYQNDLLEESLGRQGTQTHVFDIEGGRIAQHGIIFTAIEQNAAYQPFHQWIEANHADAFGVIFGDGCCGPEPNFTDESALLYRQLANEYLATRNR